jgi:hypothetical protein
MRVANQANAVIEPIRAAPVKSNQTLTIRIGLDSHNFPCPIGFGLGSRQTVLVIDGFRAQIGFPLRKAAPHGT